MNQNILLEAAHDFTETEIKSAQNDVIETRSRLTRYIAGAMLRGGEIPLVGPLYRRILENDCCRAQNNLLRLQNHRL